MVKSLSLKCGVMTAIVFKLAMMNPAQSSDSMPGQISPNPFTNAQTDQSTANTRVAALNVPSSTDPVRQRKTDDSNVCQHEIRGAENVMGIPAHLLLAVALTESGKLVSNETPNADTKKLLSAWPWTVMAEGRGRYLPNMDAAIAEVERLQAKGIRNIDVGCMQINLGYHGHAFNTLKEAFTPTNNVAYAASFLKKLRQDRHSWTRAVGFYHSSDPKRMAYYQGKVLTLWKQLEQVAIQANAVELKKSGTVWTQRPRSYRDQKRRELYARSRALQSRPQ